MGISGLLPLLRPITTTVHVRELAGLRVGVDAYVWLHRGAYGCAQDLCQGRRTKKYLNYCIERLNCLLAAGAQVTLVFDGGPLPAKKGTEHERRARREESKRRAEQCLREGKAGEAFGYFTQAVDVTPAMAAEWIRTVKQGVPNVSYVVAPYEADAQLAFLCREGLLDAVITEDSDILAFGCPRVLFKLQPDGSAQQILHADLFRAPIEGLGDLRQWDDDAFLHMCILAGCDYLPSVPGTAVRGAFKLLQRHRTADKALRALRLQQFGKGRSDVQMPRDYEARFRQALLTFRHQRVFDPRTREMAHVRPLPPDLAALPPTELEYLGPPLEVAVAAGIADGELDPITLQLFPAPSQMDAAAAVPGPAAVAAAAAAAAASQARISDYLKRAPEPEEAPEAEEEEAAAAAVVARATTVYQPGLRKGRGRGVGVGGYLRRGAAALADATAHATAGLLPRKRPAPAPSAAEEGEEQQQQPTAAAAAAAAGAATAGGGGCLPLPQVSSWFSSNRSAAPADGKENTAAATGGAMLLPVRRSAYALPTKRPRTLGASARPLLSSSSSSSALASFRFRGLVGRGGGGAADDGGQEEEEGQEGAAPQHGGKSPFGASGGYEDSLQPPTPGTPFVVAQAPPPPSDEEQEQDGEEGRMLATASAMTTTTTAAASTYRRSSATSTSIFQEFSFSSSSSSTSFSSRKKEEKEERALGREQEADHAAAAGTGGHKTTPLADVAPNSMTPVVRHRRGKAGKKEGAGAGDGVEEQTAAHSTPLGQPVLAPVVAFSFEAFQFNSSDAAALLSSSTT